MACDKSMDYFKFVRAFFQEKSGKIDLANNFFDVLSYFQPSWVYIQPFILSSKLLIQSLSRFELG